MQEKPNTFYKWKGWVKKRVSRMELDNDVSNSHTKKKCGFNTHSYCDRDLGLSSFRWWVGLVFNVHSSGDRDHDLSSFSQWVGLVFNVLSSGDTHSCLSCFRGWVGLVSICTLFVTQILPIAFQMVSWSEFLFCFLVVTYIMVLLFRGWAAFILIMNSSSDTSSLFTFLSM